jgi:hypothetical protein
MSQRGRGEESTANEDFDAMQAARAAKLAGLVGEHGPVIRSHGSINLLPLGRCRAALVRILGEQINERKIA